MFFIEYEKKCIENVIAHAVIAPCTRLVVYTTRVVFRSKIKNMLIFKK